MNLLLFVDQDVDVDRDASPPLYHRSELPCSGLQKKAAEFGNLIAGVDIIRSILYPDEEMAVQSSDYDVNFLTAMR